MKILSHLLKPTFALGVPAILFAGTASPVFGQASENGLSNEAEPLRVESAVLGQVPVQAEVIKPVEAPPSIQLLQLEEPMEEESIDLTETEAEADEMIEPVEETSEMTQEQVDPMLASRVMELRQMADALAEELDGLRASISEIEAKVGGTTEFGAPGEREGFDFSIYPRFRKSLDPTASARPGSLPIF